jgi:hypothetical protein
VRQDLTRGGIAPGVKERNLQAVRAWIRSAEPFSDMIFGPNVARFLVNPVGPALAIRILTHPDNSRITRS